MEYKCDIPLSDSIYSECITISIILQMNNKRAKLRNTSKEKRVHEQGDPIYKNSFASAFRKLSSIYVFSYFPFGFEGRIWDLIVSVPDHCLSFYFGKHVI